MRTISERYLALDVLRGMTVAFMIIVNTPGSWNDIYPPLRHAAWNGCTPTDVVFPTFLFVVGSALSFSMHKQRTLLRKDFFGKTIYRGLVIFFIGWLLNAFPFVTFQDGHYILKDMSAIRVWGVLQRIGICYIIAAGMVYCLSKRWLIMVSVILLLGYWLILFLAGDYTLEGNAVLKVELGYLSAKNMYTHYSVPFEPLGLLSTLPAVVNVLAGFLAGGYLQQSTNRERSVKKTGWVGAILVVAGILWNTIFPFNKALWTSSYVVYTTGIDLLLLSGLIIILDIWQVKGWSYFFEAFGKNPLFIYVIAWVVAVLIGIIHVQGTPLKSIVYRHGFVSWLSPENASLLFATVFMLLMWLVGYVMDKRKVYVKI